MLLGHGEGPAAVHTRLGWALQGPSLLHVGSQNRDSVHPESVNVVQTLFHETYSVQSNLHRNVEKLWQINVLPFQSNKSITRSKQDLEALALLESKTACVTVAGVNRYATPMLRLKTAPTLQASKSAVMVSLHRTERQFVRSPDRAAIYEHQIEKLVQEGYVKCLTIQEVSPVSPGTSLIISWSIIANIASSSTVLSNTKATV